VQTILAKYKVTHPFQNFTKGIKGDHPQAKPFVYMILSFIIMTEQLRGFQHKSLDKKVYVTSNQKMVNMAIDVTRSTTIMPALYVTLLKTNTI
jgi:hypothetical protein